MNKSSVKKKRAAKASRTSAVRKSPSRAAAARKTSAKPSSRQRARKPEAVKGSAKALNIIKAVSAKAIGAAKPIVAPPEPAPVPITVAQVTALVPTLQAHRFEVGQTVFYTSSPISRPGASGSYKVVRLLPSDGDDYQYRIKNPGEAFERVAKESQLEVEP